MDSDNSSATLVTAVAAGSSVVYLALWNKFTSVPLSARKVTPEQASRGRVWCFLWAAVFLLSVIGAKHVLGNERIALYGYDVSQPMLSICIPYDEGEPSAGNGTMVGVVLHASHTSCT